MTSTVLATRGERLILTSSGYSGKDQGPEAFRTELLTVIEIDDDNRLSALVVFDRGDTAAAFAELDARYLAGEAAAHAQTWSGLMQAYAALNSHEVPPTAPDLVDLDHRQLAPIGSGDLIAYLHTFVQDLTDLSVYAESVHRLTDLGAVVTHVAVGTSQEGFDAEWRMVYFATLDGGLINRGEIFEEADLDTALAQFDEMHTQNRRLETAASRVIEQFWAEFAVRDWDAVSALISDHIATEDRRRVVNAGIQQDRDVELTNMRALADVGANVEATVFATRGARLALCRIRSSNRDLRHGEFGVEMLNVIEIDTDERIAGGVLFDPDDIDAAYAELDARYLAGEAAAYANVWSAITRAYAATSIRELPPTTPDWVNVDHRSGPSFASGDFPKYFSAAWDLARDVSIRIDAVHQLNDVGAVLSHTARGTSTEGFDAEWREVVLLAFEGKRISRCEIFDEADVETALARFDELHAQKPQLENAASRLDQRFWAHFAALNWSAIAAIVDDDIRIDDRRRVVNAGVEVGREAHLEDVRAIANVGPKKTISTVVATRGDHLVLTCVRSSHSGLKDSEVSAEVLCVVEVSTDGKIVARVGFDIDDIDAAFAELDARYLAGEAAGHAKLWSEITQGYAALNRHEIPATMSEWATVDHRVRETFEGGDLAAYARSAWELIPDVRIRIEAVHRLSDLGVVATHVAHGTSQDGFDAEWRMIALLLTQAEGPGRCELFNEADLDAALARFDELGRPAS